MKQTYPNGLMTPVMEKTLIMNRNAQTVKRSLFWGCFNAALLAVISYDIMNTCALYSDTLHNIEYFVAAVLFMNTTYLFSKYFWSSVNLTTVEMTPKQQKLLGKKPMDPQLARVARCEVFSPGTPLNGPATPMNLSAVSWMSSPSVVSPSDLDETSGCVNYSLSSSSWIYTPGSPQSLVSSSSPRMMTMSPDELIQDEQSLRNYLKEYDGFEKSSLVGSSVEQPSNLLSTFWSHPVTRSPTEAMPMLRRCTYQLAPATPVQAINTTRSNDESGSPFSHCDAEIWRQFNINSNNLIGWTANLRMWISQTILERLVSEIKTLNSSLQNQGLVDICIGEVGLDRLRKTAQIPQVVQNIPSLPAVVPFLEVSPNQEYVVARIQELAKGGSMSDFKWNSGGSFDGKEWSEQLPTDAALVLHLWATYLDSQLPPLPFTPDERPFSSLYLLKAPNSCPSKVPIAISQVTKQPPHYQLVVGKDTLNIPKGRNNLFYTILLFLHHVKSKEHGMLGRMNLGQSGVNMLWILG
ncbi:transmembrane protein 209 [Nilaparvata lugens]|uniref:transmembrane protein 209 n=1 Tax=Nilaparvata lugens TaxID=108931 RepID=UPI00193EBDB0|nr:transmembrane protein 209 [Nilaparvata lugens]